MTYAFIESERANHRANHRVSTMCRALKVSKSGFYGWRDRAPSARVRADALLTQKIVRIHRDSRETYGAPRIHFELRTLGVRCARKRVARLMREAGLFGCGGRGRITETHIHADYLSGSRELAAATEATLYLSDEGVAGWKYGFEGEKLYDGDEIRVGNVKLRAIHAPGHTPEHLSFLVTDGGITDKPGFILTGDFVFVGDLGRPDLLDEAAGGKDTRFVGAKQMFESLRDKFLALPDYVQVWPGHGAGSACGKTLGAVPSSTVGYERLFSWWGRYVEKNDEESFVAALLEGQPDAPVYFGRMKRENKMGPVLLGARPPLRPYDAASLEASLAAGEVILVDTRTSKDFARGAVPGSLNIPAGGSFATRASWVIDPEQDERPIVLLARNEAEAIELRNKLSYVGIDNVVGYATSLRSLEMERVSTVSAAWLEEIGDPFVLDVRGKSEYMASHTPGAIQLHGGRVMWHLDELPHDRPIVVYCQTGTRSAVVASALRAAGFDNVVELEGGYEGWIKAQDAQGRAIPM